MRRIRVQRSRDVPVFSECSAKKEEKEEAVQISDSDLDEDDGLVGTAIRYSRTLPSRDASLESSMGFSK